MTAFDPNFQQSINRRKFTSPEILKLGSTAQDETLPGTCGIKYLILRAARHCENGRKCCPVHRNVSIKAATAADVRLGFCTESCQTLISCGHACSLVCHWPKTKHNTRCAVKLDSPCQRHRGTIECHSALATYPECRCRLNIRM